MQRPYSYPGYRKKATNEQKISFRKLPRQPRGQPTGSDQNMTPSSSSSGLRVSRMPSAVISVTSPEKSLISDDTESVADNSQVLFGVHGQLTGAVGDSSEVVGDEVDYHSYPVGHPKTRAVIEHLQAKIQRNIAMIEEEQHAQSENVNEYLRLSVDADRQQAMRIKVIFEKKNQKSTQMITQLQRKLEEYQKRLRDAEMYGITGHKQAKDVLKDVGQGLKDFFAREPVHSREGSPSGARDTSLSSREGLSGSKGKVLKNRFGSADNISSVKITKDGGQGSVEERTEKSTQAISGPYHSSLKDVSDEEASSVISDSIPSIELLPSSYVTVHQEQLTSTLTEHDLHSSLANNQQETSKAVHRMPSDVDVNNIMLELQKSHAAQKQLQSHIDNLKTQLDKDTLYYHQALDEEREHCERLEEQINDMSELHQHEVSNIKQELSSMQEKMEYQLEERTRDMQELLESCQTKITKMELQQQQQQLISMEGIENSNFRALITKLINVMLALLAVVLVLVSTLANLIGPFLTTRLRIISTIFVIAGLVATWDNWPIISNVIHLLIDKSRNFIST